MVLGSTGYNFAAGMSGDTAKVTPIEYQRTLDRMKLAEGPDVVSISAPEEVSIR